MRHVPFISEEVAGIILREKHNTNFGDETYFPDKVFSRDNETHEPPAPIFNEDYHYDNPYIARQHSRRNRTWIKAKHCAIS